MAGRYDKAMGRTFVRIAAASALAVSVAGCGSVLPGSGGDRTRGDAPRYEREQSIARPIAESAASPADRQCLAELGKAGARFDPLPDAYDAPGCNRLGTVQLTTLRGDEARFAVSNIGSVQCDLARTFGAWARFGVDRAAREIYGSGLARIETMGSYSCRNIAGSNRRSAHSRAAAIDVSGFVLRNGRRVTILGHWNEGSAKDREFLRIVHRSACKRFGTVLGPEYNRSHRDHLHLEHLGGGFCR